MGSRVPQAIMLAMWLYGTATLAQANTSEAPTADAERTIAHWTASNTTCRSHTAPALAAVAACEQRDSFSKLLAQMSYCYGPRDKLGQATWRPCDAAAVAQNSALARTTARFQRIGGVFALSATINATSNAYLIVDSGATNVQIPQEVAEKMKRDGTLADSDLLGERHFVMADGRRLQQRVIRLRTLQIGDRIMENVLATVGAPKSRALLGQSFLRRLNWWKIDNVNNTIELEFAGSF
jgi:aspartyl protease family protein